MLDSWWQRWGVAVLLVGMGSLWIYEGCDICRWRFGGRGFVGVPILSLKLGLSFGFALNFCCGYQCICRFMVGQWRVAVVVMGMGSLWVYEGGYEFGPNLCCVAVCLWAYVCCSGSRGGWW